jgi:branched-chain amino acid transport system substrate-binding protein
VTNTFRSIGFIQFFSVLISLAVAGCSTLAPGSAQQGVDNKVVTVGLSGILSGPNAAAGQSDVGAKAYFDMVNRNGGANGYTFKVVERDNQNQPAQAVAVAKQLVNDDKVFAMMSSGSNGIQALVPIAASLKAPILAFSDADLIRPVIQNMYGMGPRYTLVPLFDAQFMITTLKVKKLAYLYEDDAIGRPGLKNLPAFVTQNGAELAAQLGFAADTTDWAPYATQLRDAGAEAVMYFGGGAGQLPSLQKAADAIGYHPQYVSIFANLIPAYLKLAGPLAEGVYVDSYQEPLDASTPEMQTFRDEMTRAGQADALGQFAGQGWTGAAVIAEGVRRATVNGAALTWDSFSSALNSINNQQLGTYGSITYTANDHTGPTRAAMDQVRDRQFVQVLPATDIPRVPGS